MKGFGSAQFDRRHYPRMDFSLPLAYQSTGAFTPEGVSQNVSIGGIMALLPKLVAQGDVLEVTILLPVGEERKLCRARAKVAWVKEGEFEGGWMCQAGLQFIDLSPETEGLWRQFIKYWQEEQPA
ncbi:MAG: PilZ domain-containing protein [candidate division FCPU426 bacterium]